MSEKSKPNQNKYTYKYIQFTAIYWKKSLNWKLILNWTDIEGFSYTTEIYVSGVVAFPMVGLEMLE